MGPGTKVVVSEDMLARFAARAESYDRENRFVAEDFEDLRAHEVVAKTALGISPDEQPRWG